MDDHLPTSNRIIAIHHPSPNFGARGCNHPPPVDPDCGKHTIRQRPENQGNEELNLFLMHKLPFLVGLGHALQSLPRHRRIDPTDHAAVSAELPLIMFFVRCRSLRRCRYRVPKHEDALVLAEKSI